MSTWQITERATGTVVYAYTADEAVDWPDYPFATHNHNLVVPVEPPDPSAESIAAAVLAAMQASPPPVDARKMNGSLVIGTGQENDPWRAVGVQP